MLMKSTFTKTLYWTSCALTAIALACVIVGCATSAAHPPTALDRAFMNVETNYVPVVHVVTNVVSVTNESHQVAWQTNFATVTVTNEEYRLTPNATAQTVQAIGGATGGLFGVGGIASTALAGLFSIWASMRSSKRYQTAAVVAQNVQTLRAFIQGLPNGAAYDAALTKWMASHQAEAGVTDQVLGLLENEVNNDTAQFAAQKVRDIIAALQGGNSPTPGAK